MKVVQEFQGHTDKVNEAWFTNINDEDLLNAIFSASDDTTVKIWDKRSGGQPVQTLTNPLKQALFCLDTTQNDILVGSRELLVLYDLWKMKIRHTFQDSHSNDVTGVAFNKDKPNFAISCGEDYLLNLYDLNGEKSDDYIESAFTASQPLASCGFMQGTSLAYVTSTVGTLEMVDIEEMVQVKEFTKFEH